ncbi:MAG: hypothetical protein LBK03_04160 [Bacteroidales bacterium]|jgi:hypothetical protein|nr:hypothetical protein [Bacteroidales bacterium]
MNPLVNITEGVLAGIRRWHGSIDKQFIIKASSLKHVDDEPRFGNEPTFSHSLPKTSPPPSPASENRTPARGTGHEKVTRKIANR